MLCVVVGRLTSSVLSMSSVFLYRRLARNSRTMARLAASTMVRMAAASVDVDKDSGPCTAVAMAASKDKGVQPELTNDGLPHCPSQVAEVLATLSSRIDASAQVWCHQSSNIVRHIDNESRECGAVEGKQVAWASGNGRADRTDNTSALRPSVRSASCEAVRIVDNSGGQLISSSGCLLSAHQLQLEYSSAHRHTANQQLPAASWQLDTINRVSVPTTRLSRSSCER